jgi:hypothetical protein
MLCGVHVVYIYIYNIYICSTLIHVVHVHVQNRCQEVHTCSGTGTTELIF